MNIREDKARHHAAFYGNVDAMLDKHRVIAVTRYSLLMLKYQFGISQIISFDINVHVQLLK